MSAAIDPAGPSAAPDDRTTRARIRDAALARFAADGVAATSLKAIAADVGVSAPLVIHHFSSKEGLRAACDEHVVAEIRRSKSEAMASGAAFDPLRAMRDADQTAPLMRYLARTLADGSPHVAALIDELVDDAVVYMAEGVAQGTLKPSDHPRERAVVLTVWQLGALVLHEHVNRLLGADLTEGFDGMLAWMIPAAEILGKGVFDEAMYERLRASAQALEAEQGERMAPP